MTVFVPLEETSPFPNSPPFLVSSSEPSAHLKKAVKAIMKARRIAVVCGGWHSVFFYYKRVSLLYFGSFMKEQEFLYRLAYPILDRRKASSRL